MLQRYFEEYTASYLRAAYPGWSYEDACVLTGLVALYEATGRESYLEAARQTLDAKVLPDGSLSGYKLDAYNVDSVAPGRALFALRRHMPDERYRLGIETLMLQVKAQPRTPEGSFWHKAIYPNQVWLDGLYMLLPFYTLYAREFGKPEDFDDILLQFEHARAFMFSPETGLHYHAWDQSRSVFWADKKTGLSRNFWGRAIGWHLMALVDVYSLLPDTAARQKERMKALLIEAVDGVLRWQDQESGLLYQLTALPGLEDNYLETSASLMLAYTLYKGAALGVWPDTQYLRRAEAVLYGITDRKLRFSEGKLSLTGICKVAGLGPRDNPRRDGSVAYYLSEDIVADDRKAVGIGMMAFAQRLLLEKAGALPLAGYPLVTAWPPGN